MSEEPIQPAKVVDDGHEVRTYFVRERNALLAEADFGQLYVDYYLHLNDQGLKPTPEHDAMFKRALAGFVLHCASKPWNEMTAWTINFQQPLVNLFLTGDNETGAVTGRIFDENVKKMDHNLFYADVVRGKQPTRRSSVTFEGNDALVAVEAFYAQSEQRVARYFQLEEEKFAMLSEHPDCDLDWFRNVTAEEVKRIHETEATNLMERRIQRWDCGCNQQRMLQVLAPAFQAQGDELFGPDETIEIRCPRCSARHAVTREALEAYVASHHES
ncbi:Hsp33 family molecular chaperone HslO [Synoicihabitans lomoniglobus]|uniref:Hsp33 family molecular chaperone HslO n=1 Tax=Synoicihabitans lomoniglobus TaxID=2909285 RepID=A0AAF0A191_9BACT|nr:Hsp33 family molecular chaperone HslO [Opitutaceae bacterium LMO-M01]WED65578.1 Hsp33 family molecular chaperone HslO [Opitutaceae bacterium LMO-M01]